MKAVFLRTVFTARRGLDLLEEVLRAIVVGGDEGGCARRRERVRVVVRHRTRCPPARSVVCAKGVAQRVCCRDTNKRHKKWVCVHTFSRRQA